MSTTLWDTTGSDVIDALSAERRASGAVALGLALSFVVVTDEKSLRDAEKAVASAAAEHPSRIIVVVRRSFRSEDRLDAEVSVGGRLGPGEAVILRMYGRLSLHAESVVLPLLAPDTPVVTWMHGPAEERLAFDPLAVLASRRITDASLSEDPIAALHARAKDYAPGDTDLSWGRTTHWRALLATAFDTAPPTVTGGTVHAEEGNPSADLLAGWLSRRFGVSVAVEASKGPAVTSVCLDLDPEGLPDDAAPVLEIERQDGSSAVLHAPGRPDRTLPVSRRELGDLLAEELRRLDADQPYAEALEQACDVSGLTSRPAVRQHEWRDPAEEARAEEDRAPGADEAADDT